MTDSATEREVERQAPEPDAGDGGDAAEAVPPSLEEALTWTGWKLDGFSGASVGRVEGAITDAESGEPVWLLIRMGRFGHFSAVPCGLAAAGIGRVWVPFERDTIRGAPRVEPAQPLSREQELELCDYFRIPRDQGRAAQLSGRPEGSQTALPRSA